MCVCVCVCVCRYVLGVVDMFYPTDIEVASDEELQSWILDIYKHGFLELDSTGERMYERKRK